MSEETIPGYMGFPDQGDPLSISGDRAQPADNSNFGVGGQPQEPNAATGCDNAGDCDFQQRVQPWLIACFGEMIAGDREERNHRFLEESLELVQSCGCTASEAHQLVDYVYDRDIGEPAQEVGGVMVTLAALCLANRLDMHATGETELARIWTKVEAIRAKQAAKPKHSPLPAAPNPSIDHTTGMTPEAGVQECAALPDHADILETIENAADNWQKLGYTSALAEVRDMANVGRAFLEQMPEGYSYMNCPSEIITDLQNERDEALAALSTPMTGNASAKVIQADQDAVMALLDHNDAAWWAIKTQRGDNHPLVQAFARHRVASTPTTENSAEAVERIRSQIINSPETADFMAGVPIEAAHQRERWGSTHDAGKTPFDWFWLLGYLGQKAARAAEAGDIEKALHHTISTAAALANWHAALTGADTAMRPGIADPALTSKREGASKP
jgi:hypothetical protein